MSIIDLILSLLAPYECVGCQSEGTLLCDTCSDLLPSAPDVCYRCQRPSAGSRTCRDCFLVAGLWHVRAGTLYGGAAKELVARLKFSGARQAAATMAPCMPVFPGGGTARAVLVPVPTASGRARGRGYDQAKLLARELARRARLPYSDCLARSGHTRQLGTSRSRRQNQLKGAFRFTGTDGIRGAHVILVDDVITTGATLEAAAETLRGKAASISATVFARA